MQEMLEEPTDLLEKKKKIPEPNARIYAYKKGDVEAGASKVVTS